MDGNKDAPGQPGIAPRWTSSAKSGVGTALSAASDVWFTLSHGIVNEVYYPRLDQACIRDLGLIVTDGRDFFSEEKRHTRHRTTWLGAAVPGFRVINTCVEGRYRIEKEVITDPVRSVVLQQVRFVPLKGDPTSYHVYALLAPHLGNHGSGNSAWLGDYKGVPMLFAGRHYRALALACSAPWVMRSAGYAGVSDGWQDLAQHKRMTWTYDRATDGNVALIGEIDLQAADDGPIVLALGFGDASGEAGHRALASLQDGYSAARDAYVRGWQGWRKRSRCAPTAGAGRPKLYDISRAVLRIHEAKQFPGGLIASLSIPWGFAKGDNDLGGYHLVWPRDMVEAAEGLLAAGAGDEVLRTLEYLQVTQDADGHWPQNMWLDGPSYWHGAQMDETALPILLVDLARREGVLADRELARLWPMVRRAAGVLVRDGPVTQQDRWEEDPGYSPFTLAVEVAALLAAADLADLCGAPQLASYLRSTADIWNANVERWTYVTGSDLARRVGVEGYYVRIAPPDVADGASPSSGFVPIKNRPPGQSTRPAAEIVSPDALALVRFGLRAPNDPRILNTVKVIDALLKVELPAGPSWHRYDDDGYGEHEDGSAFDGSGIGRAWPLLTGERAHFELAAGRREEATRLLNAMEGFAGEGGLLPEQVWDAPDIPDRELFFGKASGSAMPLVWAHAEYIKLLRSLQLGRVFDMPPQPVQRYQVDKTPAPYTIWRFNHKCRTIQAGHALRVEVLAPAVVHWSSDGWQSVHDDATHDTGLAVHIVDLPLQTVTAGTPIDFTFYWPKANRWEGTNFNVVVTRMY